MIDISQHPDDSLIQDSSDKQWKDSIQSLERELEIYRKAATGGATTEVLSAAAERLTTAARSVQSTSNSKGIDGLPSYQPQTLYSPTSTRSPELPDAPSPTTRTKLTKRPKIDEQSDSSSSKSQHPMKQAGRGLLMFVTAPLAVVGMGLYAVGMMMEGVGMMLKGIGAAGKMPLEKVVVTVKGKKSPRK